MADLQERCDAHGWQRLPSRPARVLPAHLTYCSPSGAQDFPVPFLLSPQTCPQQRILGRLFLPDYDLKSELAFLGVLGFKPLS